VYQAAAHEAEAEHGVDEAAQADAAAAVEAARVASVRASAAANPRPARAASPSTATSPVTTSAPPSGVVALTDLSAPLPDLPPGLPPEEAWAAVRRCESGGNYRAVSRSGRYRGAYQFDQQTWESVGGRGDPAAALPIEQDARAKHLFVLRGARAWPVCGRALIG
jgi:hypothetical protein